MNGISVLRSWKSFFYMCKKGITTAIHLFQVDEKSAQSLSVIFLRYWLAETPVAIRKALEK